MTDAHQDEAFFRQRGFGLEIGFGERPALLVIDLVKAFTDPAMMLGADLDKEIEAINPLLDAAHERGLPVFFSTVLYDEADSGRRRHMGLKQKGVRHAQAAGTDRSRGRSAARFPGKSDSLLVKSTPRASSEPISFRGC